MLILPGKTIYGDEVKFGGGKVLPVNLLVPMQSHISTGKSIREGMGQATNRSAAETLDLVITNCLIIDWSGIYKVRMSTASFVAP